MRITAILTTVLSAFLLLSAGLANEAEYAAARAALVEEIRSYAARDSIMESESFEDTILQSLESVRRHEFVPDKLKKEAYENHPLPIGYGQTISQPYIVALMTDLVQPGPDDVILEVGTGSGYQAAVLAKLVKRVYSMEIIEPLAEQASKRLDRLGYSNVETKLGDGYFGRTRALRCDHRDCGLEPCTSALDSSTETRRPPGDSGRGSIRNPVPAVDREN